MTGSDLQNITIPTEMTAVAISEPGGPDVLKAGTVTVPSPKAGEVLIKVAAAGVNRPDVVQRMGLYPAPPGASPLPGLEVAGTVVATGSGVEPENIGRAVCALTNGGGYAEYCVAPIGQCLPIPESLTMAEAAALPETTQADTVDALADMLSAAFDRAAIAIAAGAAASAYRASLGHLVDALIGGAKKNPR